MPVAPQAAAIPGKFYYTGYTEAMSLTNYSVCVIPVTRADKAIDTFDRSYQPTNDMDKANWEAYDAEEYHGGAVGIQIVCRKFEEEKVLAIAKVVYAALGAMEG